MSIFLDKLSKLLEEIEENPEIVKDMNDYIVLELKKLAVNMQLYNVAGILRDEQNLREYGE